jgi:hypothetical protein
MMAAHFPIVFEREASGVVSAYVAGLPVYAQGATRSKAAAAIVRTLRADMDALSKTERVTAHLHRDALRDTRPDQISAPQSAEGRAGCGPGNRPFERSSSTSSQS